MKLPGQLLRWTFEAPFKALVETPLKGMMGEFAVKMAAFLALPSSEYRRYHNLTLPTAYGTTQIDHVFVSVYGVFVVETKNMGGWIFGRKWDRQWTQVFPGARKFRFQNPIRQNHKHVRAIEETLAQMGLPGEAVISVVIFVGDAELKRKMPENVTVGPAGARYIRSFTTRILSEGQVAEICTAIETVRKKRSWGTNRRHTRSVQQRKNEATSRPCPRCGRKMMLRTAKRGPEAGERFWGCEGFPVCRHKSPQ